ncbi:diguanylate cyclase domain-containing protein [Bacillus sp. 03113]|uniref:diguanylate cyclase domain-containing protein n=1 Tax=Bacillus sp. 03113 TaxID=2578211 RepID=UPI00114376D2|nr:diguanylate cyclase [Bacillus sp. 03113]
MYIADNQRVLKLKSDLFDLIDTKADLYEENIHKMLHLIHKFFNVEEITLYRFNESDDHLLIQASTSASIACKYQSPITSSVEIRNKVLRQNIVCKPIPFEGLNDYDFLLTLKRNQLVQGFLAIKVNESANPTLSSNVLEELRSLCEGFLYKLDSFNQIINKEKRYKQLFRVTEKFHSSMKIESVLGEIIYSLQEVYPSFTYYLFLSHDNNSHSDLPIKDLEYDSENIAAMQAYVTGYIQFEETIHERRSVLYAPLKGKQGVYGVLQVIAPNTFSFPTSEVEFITLLANTAGGALENAQLYQQSNRLIADLQLINEISHRLNLDLRIAEIMSYMANQISKSFEAEEVGFFLFYPNSDKIKILKGSTSFFMSKEAEEYIQYFKEKIKIEKDSLFLGDFQFESSYGQSFKSHMAVPMIQTGDLKGFALAMHKSSYHFSFENFKLMQSLIIHSTLALSNSMLREELEKMVVTDHLTKLYSRSFLDGKIKHSMEADIEGVFILIDIDNFKFINDHFGHQVGDQVIIQVANIIIDNIRATDIGSRWGGEELAIYLPKVSLKKGIAIAERLVKRVRALSDPSVTISCGVAYWNKNIPDSYQALFKRADKALYQAKGTGKDKFIVQEKTDFIAN